MPTIVSIVRNLLARSAWIANQQGDRQRAIAGMKQVVADAPAMFDCWASLHQWCFEAKDARGSLEAAQAMVRIAPRYEYGYGCLGQARTLCKDIPAAIEAYRRAVEMNPKYEFAGNSLFDLYMKENDVKSAAATLSALRGHVQTGYVLGRAVQLDLRQRNLKAACDDFAQVCVTACESPWPVNAAADAMIKAGWKKQVGRILGKAVDRPQVHSEVASRWARWCAAEGNRGFERWIGRLIEKQWPPEKAVYAYLEALAKGRKGWRFNWFVSRSRRWLRESAFLWGSVAYGMTILRTYRRGTRWTADWRERIGAESWMLFNAAEAFWGVGNDAETAAICRYAVEMPKSSDGIASRHAVTHKLHYLLLAALAVKQNDLSAAQNLMQHVNSNGLDPDYSFVAAMVQAVLEMEAAEQANRAAAFRQVGNRIDNARRKYAAFPNEPARRRLYRRCLWQVARRRGGLAALGWYIARWMGS